ncbi:MAG: PhoH family protein [Bacteroidia bacterium]|nr:PhoH family protein [Bacteroidia bacterium]
MELLGVNNQNLKLLQSQFPKLKIVSRGQELTILGDEQEINHFEHKLDQMIDHIRKFGKLHANYFEELVKSDDLQNGNEPVAADNDVLVFGPNGKIVKARTPNQRKMREYVDGNDIVFAIGPAGTGKTYTAVALAVRALKNKEIKRIILARPAVEAGENLGFLPGDLKEKIDPYLRPLYDALEDMIPAEKLKYYMENRIIEIAPMAFMRGRTLDNAFVILDEAQNATDLQLKMFLTRMGPNAKFIITGDLTQIDLPRKSQSGLTKAIKILEHVAGIKIAYLSFEDVVRHRLVKDIIKAYDKLEKDHPHQD